MAAFATPLDIAARWRPLNESELTRAHVLLDEASDMMREAAPTLDDRIDDGDISASIPRQVACEMVIAVLSAGLAVGIASSSATVGGVTTSTRYTGGSTGVLRLTSRQLARILPARRGAFSVSIATPDPA